MPIDYRVIASRRIDIRGDYDGNSVGAPCSLYVDQANQWELIDDLMAGTMLMRARGERWLPREPNETPLSYKTRLNRSFLFGVFKDTVGRITSKPFSKPVTLQNDSDLPDQLKDIATNVDRTGQDLTELMKTCIESMSVYGRAGIFVDFPNTGGQLNLAQEKNQKVRPLFKFIHPHDLIGWRSEVDSTGEEQFVQVRIREFREEKHGNYGVKTYEYIRVYDATVPKVTPTGTTDAVPVTWELFKRLDNGEYASQGKGSLTINKIPLVIMYGKRAGGFMKSEPPMTDLAELNLAHWQSSSDQRNCLRFSRIGMIAMTGVSGDEMDKKTVIAPNATLKSTNKDAKFYYVETSGGAIEAGERDLTHLEEQMEVLGAQPFIARTARSTATGKVLDSDKAESEVQMWVRVGESAAEQCYALAAEWIKKDLPKDFKVIIFSDFTIVGTQPTDLDFLYKARAGRELSQETFLRELKRRATLDDMLDVDEEIQRIEQEGPTFEQQMAQQAAAAKLAGAGGDPSILPPLPNPDNPPVPNPKATPPAPAPVPPAPKPKPKQPVAAGA